MEWTTAASLTARLGTQAYNNRHLIQRYWTRMKAFLDAGDTEIVVTGHAGAGKTMLASQLHGRARDLAFQTPGESKAVEVEVLEAGAWAKLVRVLPGQDGYRASGAIEAFTRSERLEGVIHVVDFGFSQPRDPIVAAALVREDGLSTISELRARNLQVEVNQLRLLLSDIRRSFEANGCPSWLIIAVNKIDLFADQRDEALEYYHPSGTGEFGRVLKQFLDDFGAKNLPIFILQSSAFEQDFTWNGHQARSLLERQEQLSILREFTTSLATIVDSH